MGKGSVTIWLRALRLPFLTASLLPLAAGFALAGFLTGRAPALPLMALALAGMAFLHLGANLLNDWADHRSGTDEQNTELNFPFTGGSRVIQEGLLAPRAVLRAAVLSFLLAIAAGVLLVRERGAGVLLFGALGLGAGVGYSLFFVRLYVGELLAGASFGLFAVAGAVWLHTGTLPAAVLPCGVLLSLPVTLLLWVNQFPDYRADLAAGKRNLVVRLGRRRAALVVPFLLGSVFTALTWSGLYYRLYLLAAGALLLPGAVRLAAIIRREYDNPSGLLPAHGIVVRLQAGLSLLCSAAFALAAGYMVTGPVALVLYAITVIMEVLDARGPRRRAA